MNTLKKLIDQYILDHPHERAPSKMLGFLINQSSVFSRKNFLGHFTGSAWIVSPDRSKVLLTHHKKLNKWLQLGGHSDGEKNLLEVAVREAKEESGLKIFKILSEYIFDLDIHKVPQFADEPSHYHYDVRFLLQANPEKELIIANHESHDLAWVPIHKIFNLNSEPSIKRMILKTKSLYKS
mgnify:FL=1|tara:strand:+ start:104 stop:646 length:543 start_codon:yes stop_codon:yes gene_type:complete